MECKPVSFTVLQLATAELKFKGPDLQGLKGPVVHVMSEKNNFIVYINIYFFIRRKSGRTWKEAAVMSCQFGVLWGFFVVCFLP